MKVIITTLTSWDEIPRARHQVTEALLRAGHQVIFVEKNRVGWSRIMIREQKCNLTLVTPFFPVSYRFRYRIPLINEWYECLLFAWIKFKFKDALVINFDFTAHLLNLFFKRNIYYCNDEYIGNSSRPFAVVDSYHKWAERRVAAAARFCVSTTGYLTNKLSAFNPVVYEIPLGGPDPQTIDIHRSFKKRRPLRVGLMGAIKAGHVSVALVNRLVRERDFNVVIIGAVGEVAMQQFELPSYIDFKGVLTGSELYQEMSTFDVAIAPYNLDVINAGVTPNKLFQYLACGCPVVISAIPNIEECVYPAGSVYVAKSDEEFIANIWSAYAADSPGLDELRRKYAAQNSWDERIKVLLTCLDNNHLIEESNENPVRNASYQIPSLASDY